jgi:hypothetical protein
MVESYFVGSYWLGRRESAGACARRAEHFFHLLAQLDPIWAHWFQYGKSLKQALSRTVEPTAATFESFFAKKKYQMPEQGFLFQTWNGQQQGSSTHVHICCGSSSVVSGDKCILDLPSRGANADRVLTTSMVAEVMRAVALAWEPDHGMVTSDDHLGLFSPSHKPPNVVVGWVTYLSRRRGEVPPLPEPVRVEPVEDKGSLIVLMPERFTASNPAHVELAAQVRQRLEQAGLLGPMRPWTE